MTSALDRLACATLSKLVNAYRRLRRDDPDARALFHARGIFFQPAGYYASLPTPEEVRGSFEYRPGPPPYLDTGVWDQSRLAEHLGVFARYAPEFRPPDRPVPGDPSVYHADNQLFGPLDALSYYATLRHARPELVIEVGSGFSSLVALQALKANGRGRLVCVEPYPRPFVRGLAAAGRLELVPKVVQDVPASYFADQLQAGDVLFLDSSHTVKAGSDCLYEYLLVVPRLAPGVWVHAHDIHLPEALPQDVLVNNGWCWTEQYLLLALLLENPRCRVAYGSRYHQIMNPEALAALVGPARAKEPAASLWFVRA